MELQLTQHLNTILNELIDTTNLEKLSYNDGYEKIPNIKLTKTEIIDYISNKRYLCVDIKYINYKLNEIYNCNLCGYSSKKKDCLKQLIKFILSPRQSTKIKVKKTNMKDKKRENVDYLKKYKQHIGNSRQRGIRNCLTFTQFKVICNKPCYLCKTLDNVGVDREKSFIHYTMDNSKPCCSVCNSIKSSFSDKIFTDRICMIFNNL